MTRLRRFFRLQFLRYHYGFEMTFAYLASWRGEGDVVANHELMAGRVARLYATELIN
jgi:hypothetical protein